MVLEFVAAGRKSKKTDILLDLAEWLHSYFLEIKRNNKKKVNPPDTSAMVFNRWWRKDYETPRTKRPHRDWADLIEFTGKEYGAKVVWFGGRVEEWDSDDFFKNS